MKRLDHSFYQRDVLEVAPNLVGCYLVRQFANGVRISHKITETEAYRGMEDLACHASKGRTPRTEIMFHPGGNIYVYLIYGMYWMLNIVTGMADTPQAVLIRSLEGISGPGRVGSFLQLDRSFYGEDLTHSNRLWIEPSRTPSSVITTPRVGIDYAGPFWKSRLWRFIEKD